MAANCGENEDFLFVLHTAISDLVLVCSLSLSEGAISANVINRSKVLVDKSGGKTSVTTGTVVDHAHDSNANGKY